MTGYTHVCSGQTAGIELNVGRGSYEMNGLNNLMKLYRQESGIPYMEVDGFPDELNFGAAFVVGVGKFETGVDYRYYSTTQGKLQHIDNTTESGLLLGANAQSIGLFGKYPVFHSRFFQFKTGLLVSLYASKTSHTEYYSTPSVYNETTLELRSKSVGFGPFVEPVFYFTGGLYAGIRLSYIHDTEGSLEFRDEIGRKFVTSSGESVRTDWTGLRGEVFLGLRFNP